MGEGRAKVDLDKCSHAWGPKQVDRSRYEPGRSRHVTKALAHSLGIQLRLVKPTFLPAELAGGDESNSCTRQSDEDGRCVGHQTGSGIGDQIRRHKVVINSILLTAFNLSLSLSFSFFL